MNSKAGSNSIYLGLIFLISPLLALCVALRNFNVKANHIYIILFFALYGLTFIPIPESDVENHLNYYSEISHYSFSEFFSIITGVYSDESRNPDFYLEAVAFLTSRISDSPKLFLFVIAFLYFSVLVNLMWFVYKNHKSNVARYFIVFLVGAALTWSISAGINGIRFPMAFMVFSLGAVKFIYTRKKSFLILSILSIFIHFALAYSVFFLLVYAFFGYPKKNYILIPVLLVSFALSLSVGEIFKSNSALLGQSLEGKYDAYTNEDYMDQRETHSKSVNWYVQVDRDSTFYFCVAALLLTRLKNYNLKFDALADNLHGFAIIMLLQNFFSSVVVDSLSNRYYLLFNMFTLIYLFYLSSINTDNKFIKTLSKIYIPIVLLHSLLILRVDLYTLSPVLAFGNIFFVFLTDSNISIQEFFLG